MVFPTSEERQFWIYSMTMDRFADAVLRLRPDVKDQLGSAPRGQVFLEGLPESGVSERKVVAGLARDERKIEWMLFGYRGDGTPVELRLPLQDGVDVAASGFLAVYDACYADARLPSPWCWGYSERNKAVRVADRLVKHGVNVTTVEAARPREIHETPHRNPDECQIGIGAWDEGWTNLHLSYRADLGWLLDRELADERRYRLDLLELITGESSRSPGVVCSNRQLVAGVVRAVAEQPLTPDAVLMPGFARDLDVTVPDSYLAVRDHLSAMGWAVTLDAAGGLPTLGSSKMAFVVDAVVDLAKAQRLFAQAFVDHSKEAWIVTTYGSTRAAHTWCDRADVAIFHLSADGQRIRAANGVARAYSL